jgi:hypothetical protein
MAGSVSVHIYGLNALEAEGQRAHDARAVGHVPDYVDHQKSDQNKVVLGDVSPEALKNSIFEQSLRIRTANRKAPRKDANFFICGVIGFSKEARNFVLENPPHVLSARFVEEISVQFGVKPLYCVYHGDESSGHFQFLIENIDKEGKAATNRLKKKTLVDLQNRAGEIFAEIGLSRGTPKAVRVARGEDYSKIIHRSVKELHEDLPLEIQGLKEEVQILKDLREKVRSEIDHFAETTSPPKAIKVEVLQGHQPEIMEMIPAEEFDRFAKSVQGRVALANSILTGDLVSAKKYQVVSQKLVDTQQVLEETQKVVMQTKKEVGFLRKIVDWIREYFPDILDRFQETHPIEEVAPQAGGPGGIAPPGL